MLCNKVIDLAVGRLKPDRALTPDEKNFSQWLRDLRDLGRDHLNNANFFIGPNNNPIYKRIGRAILLTTINSLLVLDLQAQPTAQKMVAALIKRFQSVSRAAQLNMWGRLLASKLGHSNTAIGVVSQLQDMILEWESMGISLTQDVFLGFIVQNSITQGSRLREEVDRRLEQYVQQNERVPLSLTYVVQTVEICRQQLLHATNDPPIAMTTALQTTIHPNHDNVFPEVKYPVEDFQAAVPQEQWPEALEFFAASATGCWHCGQVGHTQRFCRMRQNWPWRNRQPYQQPAQIFGLAPPGLIFPIFGAVYPLVSATQQPTIPPATTQQHAAPHPSTGDKLRKADYYRPTPARGPPRSEQPLSARLVDLGDEPGELGSLEFHSLQLDGLSDPKPTSRG